jgi:hypothetical protein
MAHITPQSAGKYAEFLVKLFPIRASETLRDDKIFQQPVVLEQIERACQDLANGNLNEIRGLIEAGNWPRLEEIKRGVGAPGSPDSFRSRSMDFRSSNSGSRNSNRGVLEYEPGRTLPSSSGSVTSESHASHHGQPSRRGGEQITVYHKDQEVKLSVRSSGTTYCMIGQAYLDKFPGLTRSRTDTLIQTGTCDVKATFFVTLVWIRPTDSQSTCSDFYIVNSNMICDAHALLGFQQVDGTGS